MGFTLDKVVPWGRSYTEYVNMFDLSEADLQGRILGCGDGPAGFNSVLTQRGGDIVSIDPIYAFDAAQVKNRVTETYDAVMAQMRNNQSDYVWSVISSVEELGCIRMSAMETFLSDFEPGSVKAATWRESYPPCPSRAARSTSLCRHISCFCIALTCRQRFIFRRFRKCCA